MTHLLWRYRESLGPHVDAIVSVQPGDDEHNARAKSTTQPSQTKHNEPLPLCDLLEAEPEGDREGDADEEVAQASDD